MVFAWIIRLPSALEGAEEPPWLRRCQTLITLIYSSAALLTDICRFFRWQPICKAGIYPREDLCWKEMQKCLLILVKAFSSGLPIFCLNVKHIVVWVFNWPTLDRSLITLLYSTIKLKPSQASTRWQHWTAPVWNEPVNTLFAIPGFRTAADIRVLWWTIPMSDGMFLPLSVWKDWFHW